MAYRLSVRAAEDLIDILRYGVVEFGLATAEAYHTGLVDAFDLIAAYPRAARERTEITPPVRIHRYRSHLVVYLTEREDVFILRVRHGREDWEASP